MLDRLQAGWVHPGWINYLLLPVSWLYVLLHGIKALSYRVGIRSPAKPGIPVIVVGAISVGGSGKTPLVIALGKHLRQQGYRPGVISRGYRGRSAAWPRLVEPDTLVSEVGDEAVLIRSSADLPVAAGPNRIEDARLLIDRCGCDVIISDDGFQHFALGRDLDIVVVDSDIGTGNGWCLPAGPLREPRSGLGRADIVVENGAFTDARTSAGHAMHMEFLRARNLEDGALSDVADFAGNRVHAVAALGNPQRFFTQLEDLGLDIDRHPFPDHHPFRAEDLEFAGDAPVLMTEKDAVKCLDMPNARRLWAVEARAVVDDGFYSRIDRALKQLDPDGPGAG